MGRGNRGRGRGNNQVRGGGRGRGGATPRHINVAPPPELTNPSAPLPPSTPIGASSTYNPYFTPRFRQKTTPKYHTLNELNNELYHTQVHEDSHRGRDATQMRRFPLSFIKAGVLDPEETMKARSPPKDQSPTSVMDKAMQKAAAAANEDSYDDYEGEEEDTSGSQIPDDSNDLSAGLGVQNLSLDGGGDDSIMTEVNQEPIEEEQPSFFVDTVGDPSLEPKQTGKSLVPKPSPEILSFTTSDDDDVIVFVPRGLRPAPGGFRESASKTPEPAKAPGSDKLAEHDYSTEDTPMQSTPKPSSSGTPESPPTIVDEASNTKLLTTADLMGFSVSKADRAITHLETTVEEMQLGDRTIQVTTTEEKITSVPVPAIKPAQSYISFNGQRSTPGNKRRKRCAKREDDAATEDYIRNVIWATEKDSDVVESEDDGFSKNMRKTKNNRGLNQDSEDDEISDEEAIQRIRYEDEWEVYEGEEIEDASTDEDGPMGLVKKIMGKRVRPSGLQYLIRWHNPSKSVPSWINVEDLDSLAEERIRQYEKKTKDVFPLSDLDADSSDLDEDESEGARYMAFGQFGQSVSASATADAYDDIAMDWDRPSVRLNKKSKAKLAAQQLANMGLDPEIQSRVERSWKNDREKKKLRKQQRQELREQGMLGAKFKKTGKADMKEKYKAGMTLNQIFEEIKTFVMMGEQSSLLLPPMRKSHRKTVHELATKLNLKSKSIGDGENRAPTLIKTSRTSLFEGDIEAIEVVMRHRSFNKALGRPKARDDIRRPRGGGGGGGVTSGAKRFNGEVIGAAVGPLAEDNLGRRMLEKMGYVSGAALGAEGNKGRIEPVCAVVRYGKGGLGL